jgi:hypothetical protein
MGYGMAEVSGRGQNLLFGVLGATLIAISAFPFLFLKTRVVSYSKAIISTPYKLSSTTTEHLVQRPCQPTLADVYIRVSDACKSEMAGGRSRYIGKGYV